MSSDFDSTDIWIQPQVARLADAISYTLAYADVFDYPLTSAQIHRYLVGYVASRAEVEEALDQDGKGSRWEAHQSYYTLPGRAELVALRQHRETISSNMWLRALRYGRLIARIPFVRMVALTGALTMNNVESGDDIDYLMVTESDRLWLTRIFVIGLVVKPSRWFGDEVCPNYFLTTNALRLSERNLFTAHELAQMVPLYGLGVYQKMREANVWTNAFLPNALGPPSPSKDSPARLYRATRRYRFAHRLLEPVLRTPVGGWLERQERNRKIPSLLALSKPETETCFDLEQCKGHLGSHSHTAYAAFHQRIQRFR